MRQFTVYILANRARHLYIGVTSNLTARLQQHRNGGGSRFAANYGMTQLVFVETAPTALEAIARETQLKQWRREKKVRLIEAMNPEWEDLGRYVLGDGREGTRGRDRAGWRADSSLRSE